MYSLTISFLLCTLLNRIYSKEVTHVPGFKEKLNFRHYSGYLAVTPNHMLHYWFVESQNKPSTAPVLLWLNGGPGCSSLVGFLTEMGPLLVNDDGRTVRLNHYSWNQDMNIIFLEAPAGTGYSYSTDGNITTDDDQVARENYAALKIFFGTDFPQYKKNNFYIAGQSYGGVYVPTLSKLIVDGQDDFKINLKGVLIGNGIVDASLNIDTFIPYAYWHGILSKKDYNELKMHCCKSECPDVCVYRHDGSDQCSTDSGNIIWKILPSQKINPYDINANCDVNDLTNSWHFATMFGVLPSQMSRNTNKRSRNENGSNYLAGEKQEDQLLSPAVYSKTYWNTGMFEQVKHIHRNGIKVLMYYGDADLVCNYGLAEAFAQQLGIKVKQAAPKKMIRLEIFERHFDLILRFVGESFE